MYVTWKLRKKCETIIIANVRSPHVRATGVRDMVPCIVVQKVFKLLLLPLLPWNFSRQNLSKVYLYDIKHRTKKLVNNLP